MKRSEILCRAGGFWAINAAKAGGCGVELARLTDDALVNLAHNLGVEVEPDEPPLPDVLHTHSVSWDGTWEVSQLSGTDGFAVGSIKASPRLLEAIVHAYNNRQRHEPAQAADG